MSGKKGSASRRKSTSSASPMPQLSDDIIQEIMNRTIDGSHTGLAKVSGINKSLTAALNKGSLRHSPSGNIDSLVGISYGPQITIGSLYTLIDKKHAFFFNQLKPMVYRMITREVWEFNRKYTYDISTHNIIPNIPVSDRHVRLKWEKLWVYAKLLSYINSKGKLLKEEVRYMISQFRYMYSHDLGEDLGEQMANVLELAPVLDLDVKTTKLSEITMELNDVSYDCKKMFPIWFHGEFNKFNADDLYESIVSFF